MAEQRMSGRTPVIALSLAVVALVTVTIAVIVVATRGSKTADAEPPPITDHGPLEHRVQATDVIKLDRDTLAPTTHANGTQGIKVTDVELRTVLALEATDVIIAISGRPTRRQFDVHDALLGASSMNATALYVELIREDKPVLVHWELDGDLRTARTRSRTSRTSGSFPSFPSFPSSPGSPVPDPLIDTIKKLDDFTYEVPRSTVDALLADPAALARGARIVPAMKMGQPVGLKLYAIRRQSVYGAVGLSNGDTLQMINGHPVTDLTAVLDLYDQLKGADSLRIELERRGRPEVVKITVTR